MIDDAAKVHPSAQIAEDVTIGPWTIVGANAVIGSGTQVGPHVVIGDNTTIGKNNKIYSHAVVGSDSQHMTYDDPDARLEIGDNNVIREFTSFNRGTAERDKVTVVGSNNYFMAYTHVAHDCIIGKHVVFANLANIAGHVEIGDYATLAAYTGVHQYCRIGAYSFLAGRGTKILQDIVPYMTVIGTPGAPTAVNSVGLRRHGFDRKVIRALKQACHLIRRRDLKLSEICEELKKLAVDVTEVNDILDMITSSDRGVARSITSSDR